MLIKNFDDLLKRSAKTYTDTQLNDFFLFLFIEAVHYFVVVVFLSFLFFFFRHSFFRDLLRLSRASFSAFAPTLLRTQCNIRAALIFSYGDHKPSSCILVLFFFFMYT